MGNDLGNRIMIAYLTGIWGLDTEIVFNGLEILGIACFRDSNWNWTVVIENLDPIDIIG